MYGHAPAGSQTCGAHMSPEERGSLSPSHCEVRQFGAENVPCSGSSTSGFCGPAALLKGKTVCSFTACASTTEGEKNDKAPFVVTCIYIIKKEKPHKDDFIL